MFGTFFMLHMIEIRKGLFSIPLINLVPHLKDSAYDFLLMVGKQFSGFNTKSLTGYSVNEIFCKYIFSVSG